MVLFTPDSWRNAGRAVEDIGDAVESRLRSPLSSLPNTGADGGISTIDGLIAGVLPAVLEAVDGALAGMAAGLRDEGQGLVDTGDAYAQVEDEATELGSFMEGEY